MPQREPKPRRATPFVTVYDNEGVPRQYPKAQVGRIEESHRLHLASPVSEAEAVESEVSYPAPVGGGWYELSDGQRVQGMSEAQELQEELDE